MRIVIDLQGAQGANRKRGIGQYSLQLAQALVRSGEEHEIFVALNGHFAETIEPIRAAFDGLLPQGRIVVWEAPGHLDGREKANLQRRLAAEKIRETFLASLHPDWVVVTSIFESHCYSDDIVCSIGRQVSLPTAVVLYDLIPLIYRDIYLSDSVVEEWYLNMLDHLRRANLLLSISQSAGHEAVDYLGFPPSAVVPIGTDCDVRFKPMQLSGGQQHHIRAVYGIVRPFVMYTGGIDHRKNIERLIESYAALPRAVRNLHQLAVVCAVRPSEREVLINLARDIGLSEDEFILTGYVSDEDLLLLYNACTVFVFPSWHEGFGLPVLEAMRCGKAVLAANTSSLPEVVGRSDALFDPYDVRAISCKIEHALTDDEFRRELESFGLQQSQIFNWVDIGRRALVALESALPNISGHELASEMRCRPKLAYVSPLPPLKSGIADYSAELLQELTRFYEVHVIVNQPEVSDPYIRANCSVCSVDEFRAQSASYERVLYHFGNSDFHAHMFDLLDCIPGVIVLHDFFLSGIQAHRDVHGDAPHVWAQALHYSHGYPAVRERFTVSDTADVVWGYPVNLAVLQAAIGVIVHSESSIGLAHQWYGKAEENEWAVIPHLRNSVLNIDRIRARFDLGFDEDDLLVCSFGVLGPHKLNHRLLEAWLSSPLHADPKAHLVFVGENNITSDYGQLFLCRINESLASERIHITGWADTKVYRQYLAAADIGVQLRTLSRGETSGTVLDCMNYGLATIVNANGSMADLDPSSVWMLPDDFSDEELIDALTSLARDAERKPFCARAREIIRTQHAPRSCAALYHEVIEKFYHNAKAGVTGLIDNLNNDRQPEAEWPSLAVSLALNFPPKLRRRQLLVDVSELVQRDSKSGIQRVVRAILQEWLYNPPSGFQLEPVYATADTASGYRYARCWCSSFLGIPKDWAVDVPADAWAGDIFFGLDFQPHVVPAHKSFLQRWRNKGVKIGFLLHDLLPLHYPLFFAEGAQEIHQKWLETVCGHDFIVAVSRTVADEIIEWLEVFFKHRKLPLKIYYSHNGADINSSLPTKGFPEDGEKIIFDIGSKISFLMVGTLEPRKAHMQIIEAFEKLWANEVDVNLVVVGKQGWRVESLVDKLRSHPEIGKRLFWLDGISDEYLDKIYAKSACLIAASHGEGFGLPLIEAALQKIPILARNIPVFREIAGEHAYYFDDSNDPIVIVDAIRSWLNIYRAGDAPSSASLPWKTWKQSAQCLLDIVLDKSEPYEIWEPGQQDKIVSYLGNDPRLLTDVGERCGRAMRTSGRSGYLVRGPCTNLSAGRYRLTMSGTATRLTGTERVEIFCENDNLCFRFPDLVKIDADRWKHEDLFDLELECLSCEIRLWVDVGTEMILNDVSISREATGYETEEERCALMAFSGEEKVYGIQNKKIIVHEFIKKTFLNLYSGHESNVLGDKFFEDVHNMFANFRDFRGDVGAEVHKSFVIQSLCQHSLDIDVNSLGCTQAFGYWDDGDPDEEIRERIGRTKSVYSGYILYNRETAESFLKEALPEIFSTVFNLLYHPAMRSDFFRLAKLFVDGGIYFDVDEVPLRKIAGPKKNGESYIALSPLLFKHDDGTIVEALSGRLSNETLEEMKNNVSQYYAYFNNSVIMASKGNEIIWIALYKAICDLITGDVEKISIHGTTGPGLVSVATQVYDQLVHRYKVNPVRFVSIYKDYDFETVDNNYDGVVNSNWRDFNAPPEHFFDKQIEAILRTIE